MALPQELQAVQLRLPFRGLIAEHLGGIIWGLARVLAAPSTVPRLLHDYHCKMLQKTYIFNLALKKELVRFLFF